MEFGTFILAAQRGYHQTSDQVIRNSVEQAIGSEKAGFDVAWFAEHHFNNYSLLPSPLMMVAHLAGVTKTIRLGTAVCVLPLYQPQRLLSEIGFADIVSNGRLELGVGPAISNSNSSASASRSIRRARRCSLNTSTSSRKASGRTIFEHDGKHLKNSADRDFGAYGADGRRRRSGSRRARLRSMSRGYRDGHNLFVTAFHQGLDGIAKLNETMTNAAESVGTQEERRESRTAALRLCERERQPRCRATWTTHAFSAVSPRRSRRGGSRARMVICSSRRRPRTICRSKPSQESAGRRRQSRHRPTIGGNRSAESGSDRRADAAR